MLSDHYIGYHNAQPFWFKNLAKMQENTGLDFLTMLGTTEVFINKMINEQQPRVVYFASYWGK